MTEEERDGEGMEGDNGIGPTHLSERGCAYAATISTDAVIILVADFTFKFIYL